jgi:hypothetical protein
LVKVSANPAVVRIDMESAVNGQAVGSLDTKEATLISWFSINDAPAVEGIFTVKGLGTAKDIVRKGGPQTVMVISLVFPPLIRVFVLASLHFP